MSSQFCCHPFSQIFHQKPQHESERESKVEHKSKLRLEELQKVTTPPARKLFSVKNTTQGAVNSAIEKKDLKKEEEGCVKVPDLASVQGEPKYIPLVYSRCHRQKQSFAGNPSAAY